MSDARYPEGVDAIREALEREKALLLAHGKTERAKQVDAALAALSGEKRPAAPAAKARTATSQAARAAEKRVDI